MLVFLRNGSCAVAGAAMLFATAANAENHRILIMDEAYFPAVIYVQAGDVLMFENTSDQTHTIVGEDDAWTSGPIATDSSFVKPVSDDMPLTFTRKTEGDDDDDDHEGGSDAVFAGTLSFDAPPLSN
jgi:plastocyanin